MIATQLDVALASLPVPLSLLRALVRRDVVGVLYHCVSDELVPHVAGVVPVKTVRQFESDLEVLQRRFNVVSYEEAAAHREGRGTLPPRALMLTVDDGLSNAFTVIRPILKKRGVPATFFIVTDTLNNRQMADTHKKALCNYCMATSSRSIDDTLKLFNQRVPQAPRHRAQFGKWFDDLTFGERPHLDLFCEMLGADVEGYLATHQPYLTREQVRRMSEEGFTIGAHSKSHRELWLLGESGELDREIGDSCAEVCAITGTASAPFSFPYQSNRMPRAVLAQVRARHPHVGLMFDTHGFRRDSGFIVARQCFDNAVGAPPAGSNFCLAMRHAYLSQVYWSLRGRGRID